MPALSFLYAATLVVAAVTASPTAGAPSGIRWETRIERAAALSRETGQPILVEFWATWCEACKGMDDQVYSDPSVAEAMRKVLPVRIDVDRDASTARRYNVSATPTLVLVDASGDELFRFTGAIERTPLIELLRELPGEISRINQLAAALAADPSRCSSLEALARELRRTSLYVASNRYYERAIQTDAARRDKALSGRLRAAVGENYAALKRPEEAAASYEKALRDVRGLPEEPSLMLALARVQIARGQTKEARKVLGDLMQRFKGSPAATEAARIAGTMPGAATR